MDICKKHSIRVERTAPYAHHQLGRMERQWRTLGEAAQTLLNEAHLGRAFWGHAFLTVVHIRNRVWNSGSNCIPYCAVTNKKPDLSKLRVFGCPCYVHIDSDNRNKFDDKSWEGTFVGYASNSPAWLIYKHSTGNVLRSRSVLFDEHWTQRNGSEYLTGSGEGDSSGDDRTSKDSPSRGERTPAPHRGEQPPAPAPSPRVTRSMTQLQSTATKQGSKESVC